MSKEPVTFDQLAVFLAIVETGSFSGAARRLSRAQSAVSYAIANLERLLELELFDRTGRKPVLTEAGHALVEEARAVNGQVDKLLARAGQMRGGVEPRLALAVDVFFPMPIVLDALAAFRDHYPSIPVHLRVEALGAVAQLVVDGTVQFGVSAPLDEFPAGIERKPLMPIELVTVCAAAHPLAQIEGPLTMTHLREHTQLVLTDRSALTAGRDNAVAGDDNWRLADLPAKLACLLAGFGWGNMPTHMVADDLAAGRLVRLQVSEWGLEPYSVQISVIHRASSPPGPAGRWLIEVLERQDAPDAR
ncbi:HTH-type transcriptional activator AllS [Enhygromyxa salina]|uniref:HTH-type transcriptional activator AllS n=1 Tax=Enhygromyxa salina TaxID=215803 RepID=A0A2S9XCE9_9BACT|nr:LysR family transcriptional regulator [Enhygromyxa salina]PRP90527.1 HTH-type transcriptional activator AllS [Enhygromyxa salina]